MISICKARVLIIFKTNKYSKQICNILHSKIPASLKQRPDNHVQIISRCICSHRHSPNGCWWWEYSYFIHQHHSKTLLKQSKINPIIQNNSCITSGTKSKRADQQSITFQSALVPEVFFPFIFSKGILKTFKAVNRTEPTGNFEFIDDGEKKVPWNYFFFFFFSLINWTRNVLYEVNRVSLDV